MVRAARAIHDPEAISEPLRQAFPTAPIEGPLELVGRGFYSLAVETANGLIFRIGQHPRSGRDYAREAALLPLLSSTIPVPIPIPLWHDPGSDTFPYGALGYVKVPGSSLTPERLRAIDAGVVASQVAEFLLALHAFSTVEATELGVGEPLTRRAIERLRERTMPTLRVILTELEFERIERWWSATTGNTALDEYEAVLCHGDLWYDHLLVDDNGALSGVIDFGELAVGDPAHGDFAPMMYLGAEFTAAVLREYFRPAPVPGDFAARVTIYSRLREFWGVDYSIATGNRDELECSVVKIRAGGILDPRKPDLEDLLRMG